MLRNIPSVISPDLMYVLMCMGHGEEILFADADFPAGTYAKKIIRADGIKVGPLLEAVLPFFPLDPFVERPAIVMDCSEWGPEPTSYERYRGIVRKHYEKFAEFEFLPRFEFYKSAANASAVVVTSEPDGNIILKKGPVM